MNRIAQGLTVGLMAIAAVACSHHHASNSSVGGGPSGAESTYTRGGKFSGQMSRGDYGMYGDPNVSTSGGKPGAQPAPQSTGGGPTTQTGTNGTSGTMEGSTINNSSSAPQSSGRPWYDDVR